MKKHTLFLFALFSLAFVFGLFNINAITASAQQAIVTVADIQYSATVQRGNSGQASFIWQKFLNLYGSASLVVDGKFGPLSVAASKVWQASRNLSVDGILGPMSRAAAITQINAGGTVGVSGSYPAACVSPTGQIYAFNPIIGGRCVSTTSSGCQTGWLFNSITGVRCSSGGGSSGDYSSSGSNNSVSSPTVTLTASRTSITTGTSTTLTWAGGNGAYSCVSSNGWSGIKLASGSQVVSPSVTTTYSIYCTKPDGTRGPTSSVTVNVSSSTTPIVASLTSYISAYKQVNLLWTVNPRETTGSVKIDLYTPSGSFVTNLQGSTSLNEFDGNANDGYWVELQLSTNVSVGTYKVRMTFTNSNGAVSTSDTETFTVTSTTSNVLGAESFHFTQFLDEGSSGSEVMELQKFLSGVGYDAGNVDGKFGPKTKESLIKFQIASGLKSDGIVGYEVRSFLNK